MKHLRTLTVALLIVVYGVYSTWAGLQIAAPWPGRELEIVILTNFLTFDFLIFCLLIGFIVQWGTRKQLELEAKRETSQGGPPE